MNKLLILSAMTLLLPIVPALACFPDNDEVLFQTEQRGRTSTATETGSEGSYGGRSFDRSPIPMSFCELPEPGFVVVEGKCYDFDAITDYDTEEECQADAVCKAYREQQEKDRPCEEYHVACQDDVVPPSPGLIPEPEPNPPYTCDTSGHCKPIEDPNHGEIKGDEELGQGQEQDEEEHQEEEEQGQEESEETAESN